MTGSTGVTRKQALTYRLRAQQLGRGSGTLAGTGVLDLGVQDTGADGALWALELRGVDTRTLPPEDLVMLWTLRGAPHVYRRQDLPSVAAAVRPFSDADAGKRVYDAAKPLKEAGIGVLDALDTIAATMRSVVTDRMVKGELSTRLTPMLDEPYRRFCTPCNAIHLWEMPFRLAAVRAGLELEPGTSPPVLKRIEGFDPARPAAPTRQPEPRHDVVRGYLHLLGPATRQQVAGYVEAPVKDITARWPDDTVEVSVEGERRWVLADDVDGLDAEPVRGVLLLGAYDPYLQAKDRRLLVPDPARAKVLWPALGRPGVVLVDGEVAGTWRPRTTGKGLRLAVEVWDGLSARRRAALEQQAERLAAHRGVSLLGVDADG